MNCRDALDNAGKAPLAVKALAMGIAPHELIIDPAQAGGLLGKLDAAVYRALGDAPEGDEIKGARSYPDSRGKTKRLIIIEFKRRSDTMDNYWLEGKLEAEAQYRDLYQGIQWSLPEGWECAFVPIIVGTVSGGEDEWGKAMEAIGIARYAGQRIRRELVSTLLEEFDNILRSYYAQMREGAEHVVRP